MKRIFMTLIALIGVAVMILFAGESFTVQAGKTYNTNDLRGVYHYSSKQIMGVPPVTVTDFCDGYGTLTFYGDGNVTRSGTDVCSASGRHTVPNQPLTYEVYPDGSFLMVNPMDPTGRARGQIVNKGRMLLIDGTERNLDDQLSFFVIAVKQ